MDATRIAVVGATGLVGREALGALLERGVASEALSVFGSERSVGEELEYGEDTLEVERFVADGPEASLRGVGLTLLATPAAASRTLAAAAQRQGAWVVDASAAFRADGQVPLLMPGLNLDAAVGHLKGRVAACPSATTSALALALAPLHQAFGVAQAQVTALMGASSAGLRGIRELEQQTAALMGGRDPEGEAFPHRLGFNLVPQAGAFLGGAPWTQEEAGWTLETARLFAGRGETPVVAGTAVLVPTFHGVLLTVQVRLRTPASPDQVRATLRGAPGLKVLDAPAEKVYPMPSLVTGDPDVHVGRVRAFPQAPEWVSLVLAVDNVGRAAANLAETGLRLAGIPIVRSASRAAVPDADEGDEASED